MLKLMIADGTEETRQALEALFRDRCLVQTCSDGESAKEMLQQFAPDILVVDLLLAKTDGLSLLQILRQWNMKTMVLAQTSIDSPYVMDRLHRLDVAYVMRKPCHIQALEVRIQDFLSQLEETPLSTPVQNADRMIASILMTLGFSAKLSGYGYLLDAIPLYAKDPSQSITKELYVAVGERHNKEASLIERSIRSAIEKAWRDRDDALWRQYFHCTPDGTLIRPSNGSFIARIAHTVASHLRDVHTA